MEPIAIIGIGCRFPGANNPELLWHILRNGVDTITEIPSERWDIDTFYHPQAATPGKMNTRSSGFLEQVDCFEPSFFGISSGEAQHIDPQQRLLLEVTWEALENAAIVPESLADTQTGVFIGIGNSDYSRLLYKDILSIEAYSAIGTAFATASNRLSYVLNLRGPSIAVDTACSSSLVAVNLACQSLQMGESNLCLVGGVNLILSPDGHITFSQARMLSPDGRCKTFDASADGYVRGEGCGVVILKRLSDAVKDRDNIQAVIRGSAVNQDGLTNGITAPNGPSQQAVIRQALEKAAVKPVQISYVETHGTGTPLGDAIEVNALKTILSEGRDVNQTCWIGSVKTNIGHSEAASGMASLIKVVLGLQHGEIPSQLHFKQLNPYIKIKNTPIKIPTSHQKWSTAQIPRLAGVSSFGFGGTNAHVILEEAPIKVKKQNSSCQRLAKVKGEDFSEPRLHLLTLSAKCETALREIVQNYVTFLSNNTGASLADICFTASTGRSHFNHRLALVAKSTEQLYKQLKAFDARTPDTGVVKGQVISKQREKIAFLFTGQGSQYINMGRELYETQPIFRKTLEQCDAILNFYLDKSLLNILYPQPEESSLINEKNYTQVALFSLEYALAQLWKSWGIKPHIVMGCGVGEYVAACVAGVFSLENGLKLIVSMSHSTVDSPSTGAEVISDITYCPPQINLISNLTGDFATAEIATSQYWLSNLHQIVKLDQSVETLKNKGYKVFVEIGPTGTLLDRIQQILPEGMGVYLPSLLSGKSDWQQILKSLAQLYVRGVKIDWCGFYEDYPHNRIQLPTYPFQRQRYWFERVHENSQPPKRSVKQIESKLDGLKSNPTSEIPIKSHISNSAFSRESSGDNTELIQNWVVSWLAIKLNIEATSIDTHKSFVDYGLDSLGAIELFQDLGNWLEHPLNPTLLWDFPTIESLTVYLSSEFNFSASTEKNITDADTTSFNNDILHGNPCQNVPPSRGIIARIAIWFFSIVSRFIWHIEVSGLDNVPVKGPFILAPNHESHFDGLWISSYLPASLRNQFCCLAKQEHFERLTTRLFASLVGAIPVDRQGDALPALRGAAKALSDDRLLLIHPEGTRTRTGELLPFRRGPAKLAIATGVPLIPVRIVGAYNIFPPHRKIPNFFDWKRFQRRKLKIIFGKPILPSKDEKGWAAETRLTEQLRSVVKSLGN